MAADAPEKARTARAIWNKVWHAEHARFMYSNGVESRWEPPPGHVDRFEAVPGVRAIAAFYDDATVRLKTQRSRARKRGRAEHASFHVRNLVNWVKQGVDAMAVRAVVSGSGAGGAGAARQRRLRWVDLACGRGQDVRKVGFVLRDCAGAGGAPRVQLASWHGADVSTKAVEEAQERANEAFPGATVRTIHADIARVLLPLPEHRAHVVTLHLALHYFFASAGCLHGVLSNAAHCCAVGGKLVLTYTSGEAVVRLFGGDVRDGQTAHIGKEGAPLYSVRACDGARGRVRDASTSPFGAPFVHTLHGDRACGDGAAVDATEWLTNRRAILQTAEEHGFVLDWDANAASAALMFSRDADHMAVVAKSMGIPVSYACAPAVRVLRMYHCMMLTFRGV